MPQHRVRPALSGCQARHRSFQFGLTLLELLIGLVIVGLLASIAMPSYQSQMNKQKIGQAQSDIMNLSLLLQSYMDTNGKPPASLATIKHDGFLDPWGRPYYYYNVQENGKGGARKDKNLNPINSDFDLYSAGKDGDTKKPLTPKASHDDIIRANNGRYFGLARDY